MSDWRDAPIPLTLPGEWWYFAGALGALYLKGDVRAISRPSGAGVVIAISAIQPGSKRAEPLGEITLTGEGGSTQASIKIANEDAESFWVGDPYLGAGGVVAFLRNMAALARQHRQDAIGSTPDELIEFYYRARAAGSKITLQRLAEINGLSYSTVTKRKMEYDRAGKWGAKEKKKKTKTEE